MTNPPISFEALAQRASSAASGGYPYSIRGRDLDKNFVYAAPDFNLEEFVITEQAAAGGHRQRSVKLKAPIMPGERPDQYLKWDGVKWIATDQFPKQKILRP
jgi:hypothetical protein